MASVTASIHGLGSSINPAGPDQVNDTPWENPLIAASGFGFANESTGSLSVNAALAGAQETFKTLSALGHSPH